MFAFHKLRGISPPSQLQHSITIGVMKFVENSDAAARLLTACKVAPPLHRRLAEPEVDKLRLALVIDGDLQVPERDLRPGQAPTHIKYTSTVLKY